MERILIIDNHMRFSQQWKNKIFAIVVTFENKINPLIDAI